METRHTYNIEELRFKTLLTVPEAAIYTGLSEKKIRELLNNPLNNFCIKSGIKLFVHRELLDEHLRKTAKLKLTL